jgi:hypothetical protein
MEGKRGTKGSCSSMSGSSSSSIDASMPPSSLSESLPPLVSPSDVSLHRLPSLVREHGRPSEGISVVDLSFGEEDDFLDTSHDEEFTRRLFDDLNRGLLGPLGDEEEEVREDTVDAEATPPSIVNSLTPTVSAIDADDVFEEKQDDNSDGGDEAGNPYVVAPKGVCRKRALKNLR